MGKWEYVRKIEMKWNGKSKLINGINKWEIDGNGSKIVIDSLIKMVNYLINKLRQDGIWTSNDVYTIAWF